MYKYITTDAELTSVFSNLPDKLIYGLDIETMPKPLYKDYIPKKRGSKFVGAVPGLTHLLSSIRLVQICDGDNVYVCDIQKISNLDALVRFLQSNKFVAHNAVFEIRHIKEHFNIEINCFCSMVAAKLVTCALYSPKEVDEHGEATYTHSFSLENLCAVYLKKRDDKKLQVSDWSGELTEDQIAYAAQDAKDTLDLYKYFIPKIKSLKLDSIYRLLKDTQNVVVEMEVNGMPIDWEKHSKLVTNWKSELEVKKEICKQYFGDINLNSNKQLSFWVQDYYKDQPDVIANWAKTDKGQFSFTRNKVKIKNNTKEVKALLEYKKVSKLLDSFGESLKDYVHPVTGRIHASYILAGALTGRFSSRNPNLQQQVRDAYFREIYAVKDGYLVVCDLSQIELRVQAEMSRDPVMLDVYRNGKDIYKVFASQMYHCSIEEVTKKQRQVGKNCVLGLSYGMGKTKFYDYCITNDIEITKEETDVAWETYHKVFKIYSAWCKRQRHLVETTGLVKTRLGKVRRLHPDEHFTSSCNHPIQGSAAEVLMVALCLCYKKIKETDIKLLSTVHDEILLYAPEGLQEKACKLLEEAMIEAMEFVFPGAVVNGIADACYGKNWAEAK